MSVSKRSLESGVMLKRWTFFLFPLLMAVFNMVEAFAAQGFLKTRDSVDYPFIVDSMAVILYPDTLHHERRDLFFAKLDSVVLCKEGRVNILHIGGSHVQADFLSHTIRCNLDSVNDGLMTPRGVFFPFKVANTNNPTNYKVSYKGEWVASRNVKRKDDTRLGMCGIAVSTSDPQAEIKVKMNKDSADRRWTFTRLRVLGYGDSLVSPRIVLNDTTLLFAVHDSALSNYEFNFDQPQDSFVLRLVQPYQEKGATFHLRGFVAENDTAGVVYHSIGVNGAAVPSYLGCEDFEQELPIIAPDMVIFGIGINDAVPTNFSELTFIQNYDSLISKIEKVNPNCFFLFVSNNDSFKKVRKNRRTRYYVNPNALKVEHAFSVLAEKYQGGYFDLFAWMGGLQSMKLWEKEKLAQKDKIHFTAKGYTLIGNVLYNALMESYLKSDRE